MHPSNIFDSAYDFDELSRLYPEIEAYIIINKYGVKSIDFSQAKAIKCLNTALLFSKCKLTYWDFPQENLCPAVPGRADYLYYLKDLIGTSKNVNILDLGTGATCIYPLLGQALFDWHFTATEISERSLQNADKIIKQNKLSNQIFLRLQSKKNQVLKGAIKSGEYYDAVMCNPPFFKSKEAAEKANLRRQRSLHRARKSFLVNKDNRNFSGVSKELWIKGGELAFLSRYIEESLLFKEQVGWFTSLVSDKKNLKILLKLLKNTAVDKHKIIEMQHGQKVLHILAWHF